MTSHSEMSETLTCHRVDAAQPHPARHVDVLLQRLRHHALVAPEAVAAVPARRRTAMGISVLLVVLVAAIRGGVAPPGRRLQDLVHVTGRAHAEVPTVFFAALFHAVCAANKPSGDEWIHTAEIKRDGAAIQV